MFLQNFMRQNQKLLKATTMQLCEAHSHCHPELGRGNGGSGRGNGWAGPWRGKGGNEDAGWFTWFCASVSSFCMR